MFFNEQSKETNSDKLSRRKAAPIHSALKNTYIKLHFTFLSYILKIINNLNKEFQSEAPKIHLLHERITTTFKSILKNFIKPEILNRLSIHSVNLTCPHSYLELSNLYLGANVQILLESEEITTAAVSVFKTNCLSFYVSLAKDIRSRFNLNDATLKFIRAFKPEVALSGEVPNVIPVMKIVSGFNLDAESINQEWRMLSLSNCAKAFSHLEIQQFWFEIGNIKDSENQNVFANIAFVAKSILSLPISSANVERIFSQHNLNKTKTRNRLSTKTSNAILSVKDCLNTECFKWIPPKDLLNYNINADEVEDDSSDL